MPQIRWQLAQVNIARARAPLDSPLMTGFTARLDDINALAEGAPGFVWRLKGEGNDATSLQAYEDERIIINLSVWETPGQLREFVYGSGHAAVLRQRKSWFERFEGMYYALWWIPAGHIPSVEEAKERLEHLRAHGEGERAFTFANPHGAPGSPVKDNAQAAAGG